MTNSMENPEMRRFGRYEIVAELGRGAMGVVYKARDPQIDRIVALKTVSLWGQEPDEETEFRMRFMNEAQAAGRLHHAGIVSIFDVGENPENHDPYIVLEYVAGESLNKILAREKKLPPERALQLGEEIAEALDCAHGQGVIHRDIKPANILVTEDGRAKIADFGIAKLNLAHFTLPGRVLGTPAYMAPEQLSGEGSDGRSDLFSLGVILYAMVTGHSPFQGNSATTVCFKVANREPVAASALDLNLPPELDVVIARAMAKDPEQRYQRGAEFADHLRQLQQLFEPGSTTTSLQARLVMGTRSNPTRSATGSRTATAHPVSQMEHAQKFIRSVIQGAPIRDLILGAATVILLVILGAQTKLLVTSPRAGMNEASTAPSSAGPSSDSAFRNAAVYPPSPGMVPLVVQPALRAGNSARPRKRRAPLPPSHPAQPIPIVVPLSNLDLAVQHQFKDATLYVWVDDNLTLTRPLHGGTQKRLVLFNGVRGVESQTLKIPAGKHVLRVRAVSADETIDLSKTVSAEFIGGVDKALQVTIDKHNTVMRLVWQ